MMAKRERQTATIAREEHERHVGDLNDTIKDLAERTERAEATAAALRTWVAAHLGTEPAADDSALLRDLVLALVHGGEAGHPTARAQAVDGQTIRRPKPESHPPTGGNKGARSAVKHLRRRVRAEIQIFESKRRRDYGGEDDDDQAAADIAHEFKGRNVVDVGPPGERVRCWSRSCDWYARTVSPYHNCSPTRPEPAISKEPTR